MQCNQQSPSTPFANFPYANVNYEKFQIIHYIITLLQNLLLVYNIMGQQRSSIVYQLIKVHKSILLMILVLIISKINY